MLEFEYTPILGTRLVVIYPLPNLRVKFISSLFCGHLKLNVTLNMQEGIQNHEF